MKFPFALFLALTTASVVRFREEHPVATTNRIMNGLHQPTRMTLTPLMSVRQPKPGLNFDNCTAEIGCAQDVKRTCGGPRRPLRGDGNNDDNRDDIDAESRQGDPAPGGFRRCPAGMVCICFDLLSHCKDSSVCSEGESCVKGPSVNSTNFCISDCAIVAAHEFDSNSTLEVVDGPNPTRPLECRGFTTPPPNTKVPPSGGTKSPNTPIDPAKRTPEALAPSSTPDEEDPIPEPEPTLGPSIAPVAERTRTPDRVPPATQTDDDDGVCFPASAIVHLANGKTLTVDQLQAGHEVLHDLIGTSSKIFLFTHRTKEYEGWFYQLTTESRHSITMTGNHYIYADGRLTAADSVKRGEKLRTVSGDSPVTRIRRVRGHGLYAPHSLHGDLVIDGIVVNGYSRAVNPTLAHALLAPVRWFATKTGIVEPLGGLFYNGGNGVERIMIKGADKY